MLGCAFVTHFVVMIIFWENTYSTTRWLPFARSCFNFSALSCGQTFRTTFIIKVFSPFCNPYRPFYPTKVQVYAFRNLKSFYFKFHFSITPHCDLSSTKRSFPFGIFNRIVAFVFHLPHLYFMSNHVLLEYYQRDGIWWTLQIMKFPVWHEHWKLKTNYKLKLMGDFSHISTAIVNTIYRREAKCKNVM